MSVKGSLLSCAVAPGAAPGPGPEALPPGADPLPPQPQNNAHAQSGVKRIRLCIPREVQLRYQATQLCYSRVMDQPHSKPPAKGGVQATAEMLNALPPEHQEKLLAAVAEKDPGLAAEIRKLMFTFEDFANLEDALLQKILREVPTRKLALALRSSSEVLRATLFRNLSARAGEMLREEIEALGPQRRTDVEAAQAELIEIAKRLRDQP